MTFLNKNEFNNLYGERITAIARKLEQLYQKSVRIEQHIEFLQKCKKMNLIPQEMYLKKMISARKNERLFTDTMTKIRNNILESQYKKQRLIHIDIITEENILK